MSLVCCVYFKIAKHIHKRKVFILFSCFKGLQIFDLLRDCTSYDRCEDARLALTNTTCSLFFKYCSQSQNLKCLTVYIPLKNKNILVHPNCKLPNIHGLPVHTASIELLICGAIMLKITIKCVSSLVAPFNVMSTTIFQQGFKTTFCCNIFIDISRNNSKWPVRSQF